MALFSELSMMAVKICSSNQDWKKKSIRPNLMFSVHQTLKLSSKYTVWTFKKIKLINAFTEFAHDQKMGGQGFLRALLLTSVFHKGLSFMAVGQNPTCISTLTLAAGDSSPRSLNSIPSGLIFYFFRSVFSFCTDVLHCWWSQRIKKEKIGLFFPFAQIFYTIDDS